MWFVHFPIFALNNDPKHLILKQQLLSGKKVLLVEDDEVNQMLLRLMIENQGATTVLEPNKDEALRRLKSETFDLVLLDTRLDNVNALHFTKELRATHALNMPIIGLSNINLQGRGIFHGLDDVLLRPIEYSHFLEAIDKILN